MKSMEKNQTSTANKERSAAQQAVSRRNWLHANAINMIYWTKQLQLDGYINGTDACIISDKLREAIKTIKDKK